MVKLWAKVMRGDKIVADVIYTNENKFENGKLLDYLSEICHGFDIPTPMILKNHAHNFKKFNIVKFKESDFVESIDFDKLVIENASENEKK